MSKPINKKLYEKIKKEIYEKYPKHSLFRSALLVKEYKKQNGKYENEKPKDMNIKKWFNQNWISVNDFLRDKIVKCGEAKTEKEYDEYPLCRPLEIAKKLTKPEMKKLINEKNKIKSKPLKTEKILNTKDFNIKTSITGTGTETNYLKKLLEKNKIPYNKYINKVKSQLKKNNLDPKLLKVCNDGKHKFEYENIKFGSVINKDFIIYSILEDMEKIEKGTAEKKRNSYRARAKAIYEKSEKLSPSFLSYNILW